MGLFQQPAGNMKEIAQYLRENDRFLIVSHSRPDGDAVGSLVALGLALRSAGKQVEVISSDRTPRDYSRLPGVDIIRQTHIAPEGFKAAVILECNDATRTGVSGLDNHFLINIDHHTTALEYGHLNWIDYSFGSVGQMVFRLIEELGAPVTPEIASNIYAALMTDTGNFRFSSTTSVEFADASRLVRLGANPAEIAEQVHNSFSPARVRLLGAVLSTLQLDVSGRIAWVYLTRDMQEHIGALPEDTEGIINHLLTIETVRVAAFFKQESENGFKLSLRSKGDLDVAAIAQSYNGGGHRNASGFSVSGSFQTARDEVLEKLRQLVDRPPS